MAKGLLRVKGTIDVRQFWPQGSSDADTVKVEVDLNGFEFTPDVKHNKPFRVTHIFDDAMIHGAGQKHAIHDGKLTIRLEHVDAPELHYAAPFKGTKDYRQYFGETATTKLCDMFASFSHDPVPCHVYTAVDHPNEVFDTYGRFIGQIVADPDGKNFNMNHWLIQKGWAFPSIYNSASRDEINEILHHAEQARNARMGIWAYLTSDVGHADFSLLYRLKGTPHPEADMGPVVMPKLFRRQAQWHVSQMDSKFPVTFAAYLATLKDGWVRMSEFLHDLHIKPSRKTHDLSALVDAEGKFEIGPQDIVFFEKPSTLVDARGKKITSWGVRLEKAPVRPARRPMVAA
jgi:endonuclease YncB( thermonuclease family)